MTRGPYFRTIKRNERIITLYLQELSPKEIRSRLGIDSVWIVYRAIKMFRVEQKRQSAPITQMEVSK
jgi:transposase-like protein